MTSALRPAPIGDERPRLSALLEEAAAAAAGLGTAFGTYRRQLAELGARFAEGRLHLAVLGQFKRGKSTLLNALVAEPVLPVGVVPITAAPTFIQFGVAPRIGVQFLDGSPREVFEGGSSSDRQNFLARFVTEEGIPRNRLGVAEVQVALPAPILESGVVLIDTPGIGSTYRHNTAATLNFLEQCDAALFLVSADPPITEVELGFLRQVRDKVPRLFFVLNKIDYLTADELQQALTFYRRVLAEQAEWEGDGTVFCLSARRGLEARLAGDAEGWATSGVGRLEAFLVEFLAREKFQALMDAVSRRALDLVEALRMEAAIALEALKLPQQALEEKMTLFEASLKRAEGERRLIQDVLEGDKKRVTAFVEEASRELRGKAGDFLKGILEGEGGSHAPGRSTRVGIQEAWAEAIPGFFGDRQAAMNEGVKARLLECLTPHEERLTHLVETLRHTTADLFQVPYRPLQPEEALEIKRKPYWVLNTWNTEPLPLLQSMDQRLDELVRRNVENIRWSTLQNLTVAFARFAGKVKERLAETVATTQGAMEAARERRRSGGDSVAPEVERLAARLNGIEGLKGELAALRSELAQSAAAWEAPSDGPGGACS
jgi:hypothetical protein